MLPTWALGRALCLRSCVEKGHLGAACKSFTLPAVGTIVQSLSQTLGVEEGATPMRCPLSLAKAPESEGSLLDCGRTRDFSRSPP